MAPGLCPPRDRPQSLCRRGAAEPTARCSSRNSTKSRRASRLPGGLFRPWRAEIGAGRCAGAQSVLSRCDLSAGLQGPQAGDAPPAARPPCAAHRPCRPSRSDRHDGPAAGRRGLADRDRGRCRAPSSRSIPAISATSPRRRCRSKTPPASSRALKERFPAIDGAGRRSRSAMPPPTARKRSRRRPPGADSSSSSARRIRRIRKRLVEVAERAGARKSLLVQRASEIRLGGDRRDRDARPVRRRVGAGDASSTRSSRRSARASTSRVELAVTATETENFPVDARPARCSS